MAPSTPSGSAQDGGRATGDGPSVADARARSVSAMVSASLLAVLGTLVFAWAMRTPDYPWLFAVGALPWTAAMVLFARAFWRLTHL